MDHAPAITHPLFITGAIGRPYCAAHPSFNAARIPDYNREKLVRPLRAHSLACPTCIHYQNDDCYFSKASIDIITKLTFKKRIRCDFCLNWFIGYPLAMLKKMYLEHALGERGYIICPFCDQFVKTGRRPSRWYAYQAGQWFSLILVGVLFGMTIWDSYMIFVCQMFNVPGIFGLFAFLLFGWVFIVSKLYRVWKTVVRNRRKFRSFQQDLARGYTPKLFLSVD